MRAIDVFPIPPEPVRATVRFSASPTIFLISLLRPKKAPSDGGNSPGGMLCKDKIVDSIVFDIADLVYEVVSNLLPIGKGSHLLSDICRRYLLGLRPRCDVYSKHCIGIT